MHANVERRFMAETSERDGSTAATGDDRPDRRPKSADELRDLYADQAGWMGRLDWCNRLLTGRYRRRLFWNARGRVLDVACGTGTNFRYLSDAVEYVGVDLSPAVLREADARFDELRRGETLLEMNAQALDFPDDSFDTVVTSLSTCTFPDPDAALGEMARVCRPDGRIRLLEHGRSTVGPIARFQDWRADAHYEKHGCRWNQKPVAVVAGAGLEVLSARSSALGMMTGIVARPGE